MFSCDSATGEENTFFCHCMSLRSQRYAAPLGLHAFQRHASVSCEAQMCINVRGGKKEKNKLQFFIAILWLKGYHEYHQMTLAPTQVVDDLISSILFYILLLSSKYGFIVN